MSCQGGPDAGLGTEGETKSKPVHLQEVPHLLTLSQHWKQGFPGHPVAKTQRFRRRGCRFDPRSGELRSYKSPGTAPNKQNNNKNWKPSAMKDTKDSCPRSPLQRTSIARGAWQILGGGRKGRWLGTHWALAEHMAPQARAHSMCVHTCVCSRSEACMAWPVGAPRMPAPTLPSKPCYKEAS